MQMGPRARSQEGGSGSYQSPVEKRNESAPQTEAPKQQNDSQEKIGNSGEEEIKIEDIPF